MPRHSDTYFSISRRYVLNDRVANRANEQTVRDALGADVWRQIGQRRYRTRQEAEDAMARLIPANIAPLVHVAECLRGFDTYL